MNRKSMFVVIALCALGSIAAVTFALVSPDVVSEEPVLKAGLSDSTIQETVPTSRPTTTETGVRPEGPTPNADDNTPSAPPSNADTLALELWSAFIAGDAAQASLLSKQLVELGEAGVIASRMAPLNVEWRKVPMERAVAFSDALPGLVPQSKAPVERRVLKWLGEQPFAQRKESTTETAKLDGTVADASMTAGLFAHLPPKGWMAAELLLTSSSGRVALEGLVKDFAKSTEPTLVFHDVWLSGLFQVAVRRKVVPPLKSTGETIISSSRYTQLLRSELMLLYGDPAGGGLFELISNLPPQASMLVPSKIAAFWRKEGMRLSELQLLTTTLFDLYGRTQACIFLEAAIGSSFDRGLTTKERLLEVCGELTRYLLTQSERSNSNDGLLFLVASEILFLNNSKDLKAWQSGTRGRVSVGASVSFSGEDLGASIAHYAEPGPHYDKARLIKMSRVICESGSDLAEVCKFLRVVADSGDIAGINEMASWLLHIANNYSAPEVTTAKSALSELVASLATRATGSFGETDLDGAVVHFRRSVAALILILNKCNEIEISPSTTKILLEDIPAKISERISSASRTRHTVPSVDELKRALDSLK